MEPLKQGTRTNSDLVKAGIAIGKGKEQKEQSE